MRSHLEKSTAHHVKELHRLRAHPILDKPPRLWWSAFLAGLLKRRKSEAQAGVQVLWVATKAPYPPRDGGRLVQWLTLEALAARGVEVTLVAPVDSGKALSEVSTTLLEAHIRPELVSCPRASPLVTAARALWTRTPWTLAAHRSPAIEARVEALASRGHFEVIHAEQLQTWPQTAAARRKHGIPVLLRAQNVESDLWKQVATKARMPKILRGLLRREAARLASREGEAVRKAAAVTALTVEDAMRLSTLAAGRHVWITRAPFPDRLPAGRSNLDGDPALTFFGSGGWWPNRDAATWLSSDLWPTVRRALPEARLHVHGSGDALDATGPGVVRHPGVPDSRDAFAPGSILLVPLRVASGVRIKILEAWARGTLVAATPEAVAGLPEESAEAILVFRHAEELVEGLSRLRESRGLREQRRRIGRELLRRHHDPARIARDLQNIYQTLRDATTEGSGCRPSLPIDA